jgi:hypothetical protein
MVGRLSSDAGSLPSEVSPAVVALEAQGKHHRPPQQPRVGRTVGGVASLASVDANAEMLEDEGTPFVRMTVKARLFVGHGLVYMVRARAHPPGWSKRAMRIVAVRARDDSFLDTVFEGHRQLRPHVGMAPFAERRLRLAQ